MKCFKTDEKGRKGRKERSGGGKDGMMGKEGEGEREIIGRKVGPK